VLARRGVSVVVLERDMRPVDRVRGEFMAPWGVAEAASLGLLDILQSAGGFHVPRAITYDENVAPDRAEASARDLRTVHPIGTGPLCAGHPAMCDALCSAAERVGARVLRGVSHIAVAAGEPPSITFEQDGRRIAWRPRLIVGADGRNSTVQRQLGFAVCHDEPHNLIGGMRYRSEPQDRRRRFQG
jgi:2-polyprenyl-6-methoxyphenol hydroxylase-like FAD-dependent oxidoreductase